MRDPLAMARAAPGHPGRIDSATTPPVGGSSIARRAGHGCDGSSPNGHAAPLPAAAKALHPLPAERWFITKRATKRWSAATALIVGASIALHATIAALVLVTARGAPISPPQQEIAVEIVQDDKKPTPVAESEKPIERKETPAARAQRAAKATSSSKPAGPASAASLPLVQPPAANDLPRKPAPNDASATKEAARKVEDLESKARTAAAELESLKQEFARLNAEKAELKATSSPVKSANRGLASGSFKPVSLAGTTGDGTDNETYEVLVFSQIEKAKGFAEYKGRPGAVNVRFSIGDHGELADVEVATTSGRPELDEDAVSLIKKAAPFPVPPAGSPRTFTSGVSFGFVNGVP